MEKFSLNNLHGTEKQFITTREGRRLEAQVLEEIECEWDGEQWINIRKTDRAQAEKMFEDWLDSHIMPFKDWNRLDQAKRKEAILEWVKKNQPADWNPAEPPVLSIPEGYGAFQSTVPADLHTFIAEHLGLEDYSQLQFYTAVGTPLDTLYGIDGFLEYNGIRFTIDVTKNTEKINYGSAFKNKADYVLTFTDMDEEGNFQKIPESQVETEGKNIAHYIKRQIEENKRMEERGLKRTA